MKYILYPCCSKSLHSFTDRRIPKSAIEGWHKIFSMNNIAYACRVADQINSKKFQLPKISNDNANITFNKSNCIDTTNIIVLRTFDYLSD